jgi:C-terminal processing protease CtpA/Prc
MKGYLLLLALCLAGCSSVKNYNAQLNEPVAANALQADVDYIHSKLEKLHPHLYWYISKKDLDYKFDSLKATITRPMTRSDFHKKLSPVISAVREGHMYVYPPMKMYTKKQNDSIKKAGVGPLSQFDFDYIDGKLYVLKNKSADKSIPTGAEVVAVNDDAPSNIISEYNHYYTSDGSNTTFKKNFAATRFSTFYTYKNGLRDSIRYQFKFDNEIKNVWIKRRIADTTGLGKKTVKNLTAEEKSKNKKERKALRKKKDTNGYDDLTKVYNRELHFAEKDSSVAIMKIRSFFKGTPEDFYAESFRKIKDYKAKTLVIDFRNNGGGRLSEIADLYSYLADSTFVFIDPSQVVKRTSLMHADYFKGGDVSFKILKGIFSPFFYSYVFLKIRKADDGTFCYYANAKPKKIKPDAFKGKVYVLINGGSFSATSIISANLQGSGRAYFVGEETGGAYNGSVAGMLPLIKLPNSDLKVRMGLIFIAPHYKTAKDGRGIFPDKEIIPTVQDRINGIDPEMNWIVEDIHSKDNTDISTNQKL